MNKKYFSLSNVLKFILAAGVLFFPGCEEEITDSLDTKIKESNAAPLITSVIPASKALSGVTEVVINGENFSTVFEENFVTFGDGNVAEILQASVTQLIVKAPLVPIPADSDGVNANIRVAVAGAELPSEKYSYRLLETVKELYVDAQAPLQYYGICVDSEGSIIASAYSLKPRVYKGEYKIPAGGEPYLYDLKGDTHFGNMKIGPDGVVLAVRADFVPGIYMIEEGKRPELYKIITFDFQKQLSDFAVDDQKRIWAGGKSDSIYTLSYPDKKITRHAFNGKVNALEIFKETGNTFLYLSIVRNSVEKIYRVPINSDGSLGQEEMYFDVSQLYLEGTFTRALIFAADGTLFIGNNGLYPVIMINPDKTVQNLYPELLKADVFNPQNLDELISMTWGLEDDLYIVRRRVQEFKQNNEAFQNIVRVLTGKAGAPNYGRN
ncbi:MAG: IPT/TIG domain-containing protein [Melioribacteraceae bacterium]|nr:IPT/TIG domain-containing protein [Melioribacteraceae bacterium]